MSPTPPQPSDSHDDSPELRLVRDKPLEQVGPFRFERRRQYRWETTGQVTFVDYGQSDDASQPSIKLPSAEDSQKRIGSLQLRDVSASGVGVWSQSRLPEGSRVAVFFPPVGNNPGYDRYGTVVRCIEDAEAGQGWDIGMELESQMVHAA